MVGENQRSEVAKFDARKVVVRQVCGVIIRHGAHAVHVSEWWLIGSGIVSCGPDEAIELAVAGN